MSRSVPGSEQHQAPKSSQGCQRMAGGRRGRERGQGRATQWSGIKGWRERRGHSPSQRSLLSPCAREGGAPGASSAPSCGQRWLPAAWREGAFSDRLCSGRLLPPRPTELNLDGHRGPATWQAPCSSSKHSDDRSTVPGTSPSSKGDRAHP